MISSQTEDPRVAQIRAAALQRGYSPAEIDQKLMDAGMLQRPTQPTGVGGGYGMLSQMGGQLMHGAGLAARGIGQGVGAMGDMATHLPPPYGMGGIVPPGMVQGAMGQGMDRLGVPQPQTPGERIGVAGAEGATMGGPFGMAGAALGAGANMAGQGAGEMGAGPLGQMAASAAVGLGLPIAGMVLSSGIRSALAGAASRRAAAAQSLQLIQAGDPNAAVTLGQVAEGGAGRTIEGGLKNIPGGGGPIQRSLDKQAQEMGARVEGVANRLGRATSTEVVGKAVQRGIEDGFIPNFKATADQLYQKVYALVPPNSEVSPTAVTRLIANQNQLLGMSRELSDDIASPKFAGILNHLDEAVTNSPNGTIPFAVVKELRSRLGAMISGEEMIPDVNLRDVKRLYGALTEDMGAAVQKVGGAPGTQAWNRANTFWQKGTDRIEKILDPLVRKRTPEQAFTAMMSGTKDGATALRSTLQSLDAGSQGLVRSHVLRQLGRMPDDSFSPELFLRKLNGLAPTTTAALFEGQGQVGTDLAALAKIAEARKASGRVMFNPSGTAQNTAFFAILNGITKLGMVGGGALAGASAGGGAGAAMGAVATPIVANQLAERVFTNPRMINWLVKQTRVPFGAMRQELALLAKDAQKWGPADRTVAEDFSSAFGNIDWRSILMAQAAADASSVRAMGQ